MGRYDRLFNAFGPTALGQIAGATAVGGLVGFGAAARDANFGAHRWEFAAGGAAMGFVAAVGLVAVEVRRSRVKAGVAKPLPAWAVVLLTLAGLFFCFVAFVVYVMH